MKPFLTMAAVAANTALAIHSHHRIQAANSVAGFGQLQVEADNAEYLQSEQRWFYIDDFLKWLGCKIITCDK